MTSTSAEDAGRATARIAVLGTGLIGTSIALAAARAGILVRGWDVEDARAAAAAGAGALEPAPSLELAVDDADLVIVSTPIPAIADTVVAALEAAPGAIVSDTGSIKGRVNLEVASRAPAAALPRFVSGHPMGGSERSGPEHASASVVDGIVWVVAPAPSTSEVAVERLSAFVRTVGARPVALTPERHDRLVAFVSHLPQVASTSLMGLAATEEAHEPDILLLAAGGFRDLTRLAASDPALWSDILVANREQIVEAIDLYVERLGALRDDVVGERGGEVERTFEEAKRARLRLATKPQVRAGVAVLQVEIPDEPGALARITATIGDGGVNIEDLQIVHSPEGGRGTVHLTVVGSAVEDAFGVLRGAGYDPTRLA
ncbi:MAG TPA: prephenate dehydrogenase/arogenate dehydrogenase family protein [Actinomycetota bacterium]|jgi:prephenate dehydrogenase